MIAESGAGALQHADGVVPTLIAVNVMLVHVRGGKVTLQPLTTSNYFAAGHKLRIEVSSSNFPRFDRNLNTGGNNYDETRGVVAHNTLHHADGALSWLELPVLDDQDARDADAGR